MGFEVRRGERIENYCGDVIINSVGVTSTIYGGICGSIVQAAKSIELEEIINSVNDAYTTGEFFFTDGYGLKVTKILHLITPNHKNDKDCKQYKECVRRILNECQANHLFRIGLPLIGAGANKYNDVAEGILTEMCDAYCKHYKKMQITLVIADNATSEQNKERIRREAYNFRGEDYHDPKTMKKFEAGSKEFEYTMFKLLPDKYTKEYFDFDNYAKGRKDIVLDAKCIKTIGKYVEAYMKECDERDILFPGSHKAKQRRIAIYFAFGKKGKDTYVHSGSDAYGEIKNKNSADKRLLFKLIFALRMTFSEAEAFLHQFGYSFAYPGVNKTDDAVKYLLSHNQYGIVEANLYFKKENITPLLFAKK